VHSKAGFLFWSGDQFSPFSFGDFLLDAEYLRSESRVHVAKSQFAAEPDIAEVAADHPVPVQPVAVQPVSVQPRWRSWTLLAVSAAVMMLVGLSALMLRDRVRRAPPQVAQTEAIAPPLRLEVEAQGNGVNIRWDPVSSLVKNARTGELVVVEQDQPPQVTPLDAAHLAAGHV
jgi:hypothetical protein